MEIQGTDGSARITALENKVREMEALTRGLINETLDLRSDLTAMYKEADELSRQELKRGTGVRSVLSPAPAGQSASPSVAVSPGSTVVRPRVAVTDAPATPAEPAMVRIMQADGTMKMEPRCGDRHQTDSTGGYGPDQKVRLSRPDKTR